MHLFDDKRALIEKLRFFARVWVPFHVLIFSVLRTYLETVHFEETARYSFYRSTHHVFWFATIILFAVLFLNLVTRVQVKRLIWFGLGMHAILLPILWAWLTGHKLALAYHPSTYHEMFRDMLTFVWTAPHNRPVMLDGGLGLSSMALLAYFYTRSWKRFFIIGIMSLALVNFFAVVLIGPPTAENAFIKIGSAWTYDPFISAFFVFVSFWTLVAVMARAGLFSEDRRIWAGCALLGVSGWAVFSLAAYGAGWFPYPYDAFMTGFPMGFCLFLLARVAMWMAGRPGNQWALGLFLLALACQAAVFSPIYAGNHEDFTYMPKPVRVWARNREPFSRLRLLPGSRFDFSDQEMSPYSFDPPPENDPEQDYGQGP
ncbi:MAG: hypothetical protein HZB23_14540 [Deltaproteobacteria bacterium]|nr:hypothetical protein [Deltaproteobacteria bacterium]